MIGGRKESIASRIDANRTGEVQENRAHVKEILVQNHVVSGKSGPPLSVATTNKMRLKNNGNVLELLDVVATDDRNMKSQQEAGRICTLFFPRGSE